MKQYLNNIKHEAGSYTLTTAEKAAMRKALLGTPAAGVAEEFTKRLSPYMRWSFSMPQRVFAAVLVVFLVGGGTASAAASSALPGDLLYPIKININEKVELALAQSPQAKVAVETQLATRRVSEALSLEAKGRFNEQASQVLEKNFDEHASEAIALARAQRPATVSIATEASDTNASQTAQNSGGGSAKVAPTATLRVATEVATQTFAVTATETASTTVAPMATATIKHDQGEDANTVEVSLQEQKRIFIEIKQRAQKRGGEVRGAEVERGKNKNENRDSDKEDH